MCCPAIPTLTIFTSTLDCELPSSTACTIAFTVLAILETIPLVTPEDSADSEPYVYVQTYNDR